MNIRLPALLLTQQVVIVLGSKKNKNINVKKSGFLKLYKKAIQERHLIKPLFVEKN